MKRNLIIIGFVCWMGMLCLFSIGCATLLTEQEYALINEPVKEEIIFSGVVFSIPKKHNIGKVVILGSGTIQNFDIHARDEENDWKLVKQIKKAVTFPIEVHTRVHADAIRIWQKTTTGKGHIDTVQFYTIVDKGK